MKAAKNEKRRGSPKEICLALRQGRARVMLSKLHKMLRIQLKMLPLPAESINVAPQPEEAQSSNPRTAVDFQTALELLRAHDASMVDYEREWNEIEAEERRVRIELDQALPGDPLLGHATSSQQSSPLPEIPFEVITTRYGTVYHSNQNCRYLTAPMTGAVKSHRWCGHVEWKRLRLE